MRLPLPTQNRMVAWRHWRVVHPLLPPTHIRTFGISAAHSPFDTHVCTVTTRRNDLLCAMSRLLLLLCCVLCVVHPRRRRESEPIH